ncbi:hypothetical protein SSP24_26810 [Streptomyces spinoverrucosus]|uniref:Uncharacterized protein n=1 Tax=Streptomyces spinoverrucosus TaxID=284043 RepID=A0A4Y3VJ24_9ACTN|nr:hypothetical protein SSP24_26810 [Streptomyces spinoverrucosus]GHB96657.1 hypothetical protein GCM10010397_81620 [Streptomyces spinoverrucosus]
MFPSGEFLAAVALTDAVLDDQSSEPAQRGHSKIRSEVLFRGRPSAPPGPRRDSACGAPSIRLRTHPVRLLSSAGQAERVPLTIYSQHANRGKTQILATYQGPDGVVSKTVTSLGDSRLAGPIVDALNRISAFATVPVSVHDCREQRVDYYPRKHLAASVCGFTRRWPIWRMRL